MQRQEGFLLLLLLMLAMALSPSRASLLQEHALVLKEAGGGSPAAPAGGPDERGICIRGRALPRLFLLGMKKCGTTSMAFDLVAAGAQYLFRLAKEPGIFADVCTARNETQCYPQCPSASPAIEQEWLDGLHWLDDLPTWARVPSCGSGTRKTILDATTFNARLPGLPPLLRGLYGNEASRLAFVLLYREPMARLQSDYWFTREHPQDSYWSCDASRNPLYAAEEGFGRWLEAVEPGLRGGASREMSVDFNASVLYASFYGLTLEPWLRAFDPGQFLVVPFQLYFNASGGGSSGRRLLLSRLAAKFGATLSPELLPMERELHLNGGGPHPALAEEVSGLTIAHWYRNYFTPDLLRLAELLGESVPLGLEVIGYTSGSGSSSRSLYRYLCWAMPCLM